MSAPDGVGSLKKRARREGFRYQMELNFGQKEDKDHFLARLDRVKGSLATKRRRPVDNTELLSHLLDLAEKEESEVQSQDTSSSSAMLNTSGIYAGDGDEEQPLFVCEVSAFEDLVLGMTRWCTCGMVNRKMISYRQSGHVIHAEFQCQSCNRKEWWASSSLLGSRYLINQKLASLGTVGKRYTDSVYNSKGYVAAIESCAEASMTKAIDEIKATSEYETDGEWVITDARHDSTANAYHTTVPCLSGSIHKIVGCVTLSRKEHTCAQTRELACTKEVLPLVMSKGLNVTEVAHDNSPSVTSYIVEELQLKNSYDTWHGTKNVAKAMTSIATGTKKRAGITWYPELSDKRKSTKTHLYYSMKNCNKSPENLRDSITNIVDHYQGKHSNCNQSSSCRRPGYAPSKKLITDPNAVEAYTRKLKQTLIYVNAESYCSCRDTFWVESFNHHLLTYLPKRIHFGTTTFRMRMNIAVMDWNENVERPHTSERYIFDIRRPDRRTPFKALVEKTYQFADNVWKVYLQKNQVDIRPNEPVEEVSICEVLDEDDEDIFLDGDEVDEVDDEQEDY